MFYAEFRTVLGAGVLESHLLPQAKHIVVDTLLAARLTLEVEPQLSGAGAFNVYGFDLMVDAQLNVKLVEVWVPGHARAREINGACFELKFV